MTRVTLHDRKPLSTTQRVKLFFERKGECCICHGKIGPTEAWIDEHIIPLALGGGNEWDNRGCAHVKCAKDKTRQDMADIAKAKRREAKHIGAHQPKRKLQSRNTFKPYQPNTKHVEHYDEVGTD